MTLKISFGRDKNSLSICPKKTTGHSTNPTISSKSSSSKIIELCLFFNKNKNLIDQFIVVANMLAKDGGKAILDGNTRVLRSRLKDAKFFFENDLRVIKTEGISSFTKNLSKVTFHNKIGSQLDRINNIEELSN